LYGCEARFPKHKRTVQVVPKMPMPVRTTVQVLIYTAKQYECLLHKFTMLIKTTSDASVVTVDLLRHA